MGQNLKQLLLDRFNTFRVRDFKQLYTAVTESILLLLSEGYIHREEGTSYTWTILKFLKVFTALCYSLGEIEPR